MTPDPTIEEVNKAIDEILLKPDTKPEIKKRKPQPFRYLTNPEEIKSVLEEFDESQVTVMKEPTAPKIVEDTMAIVGLGDVDAIESVIRKHEASRKFK
jgi:hypothetical protein